MPKTTLTPESTESMFAKLIKELVDTNSVIIQKLNGIEAKLSATPKASASED